MQSTELRSKQRAWRKNRHPETRTRRVPENVPSQEKIQILMNCFRNFCKLSEAFRSLPKPSEAFRSFHAAFRDRYQFRRTLHVPGRCPL